MLAAAIADLGKRALVVTGGNQARALPVLTQLKESGTRAELISVPSEPDIELVDRAAARARATSVDLVIGFGGGSPLDVAKAVSVLATNDGSALDYIEVVGAGRCLERPALPCIAIPTTAGTGSEVTSNAVLQSRKHRVKASLRSPHLRPRIALVDPELALTLPPPITAAAGMDALTQLIEPFVSSRASSFADAFCREGLRRAARGLARAYEDGTDLAARADMAFASLASGLAFSLAGLGAVHGLAGPIGGLLGAPHGALCGALLAPVMATNARLLRRAGDDPWCQEALDRYDEIARILTGCPQARAADGISWVKELRKRIGVPGLAEHGLGPEHLAEVAACAARASSMRGNPIPLRPEEIEEIITNAL
jgi:alcohol dehydrogenase class IV